MQDLERDRAFFEQRGFGRRIGFGAKPALIVVDFQRAFTNPAFPLGANTDAEIAATKALIAAARAGGAPVFYTAARYDEPDCRDAGVWGIKQGGIPTLQAGSGGELIDERLDVRADEHLIWKKRASGFFATDLLQRLIFEGVDSVVICGVTTSGCVRATAIDAVNHNYRTSVVREAVGDRAEAAHLQSLFDLDQKYCDVVALAEAVAHLAGTAAQVAR